MGYSGYIRIPDFRGPTVWTVEEPARMLREHLQLEADYSGGRGLSRRGDKGACHELSKSLGFHAHVDLHTYAYIYIYIHVSHHVYMYTPILTKKKCEIGVQCICKMKSSLLRPT